MTRLHEIQAGMRGPIDSGVMKCLMIYEISQWKKKKNAENMQTEGIAID